MLATALALAVLPQTGVAQVEDTGSTLDVQRVELAGIGISASFPAGWKVMTPMVRRASWFDRGIDDTTPVYAWAAVFATAGDGRWCDIDRFEDFPWSFAEHAAFLERWNVSGNLYGVSGGYEPVELPAGSAYRIDVDDELQGRSSVRYLFEYGSDRILLTCSDVLGSSEDWTSIAESIELGPRTLIALDASTSQ